MSAATIPFTPAQPKPWTPTDRERLIFQWVKFEGQTQSWVADQFEISQSTVSRIIERYEHWIARGGPVQQGALNHEERLRTQRWLTYERNEWLLASALRLASEMERALDTSKSTVSHPTSHPSRETEVRTEHKVIDRSGLAARYLRLAYRINMDQLKLVERDPLSPLPFEESQRENIDPLTTEVQSHTEPQGSQSSDLPEDGVLSELPLSASVPLCEPVLKTENRRPPTVAVVELSPDSPPMHTVHNPDGPESKLTNHPSKTSAKSSPPQKPSTPAYPVAAQSPERGSWEPEDAQASEFRK